MLAKAHTRLVPNNNNNNGRLKQWHTTHDTSTFSARNEAKVMCNDAYSYCCYHRRPSTENVSQRTRIEMTLSSSSRFGIHLMCRVSRLPDYMSIEHISPDEPTHSPAPSTSHSLARRHRHKYLIGATSKIPILTTQNLRLTQWCASRMRRNVSKNKPFTHV